MLADAEQPKPSASADDKRVEIIKAVIEEIRPNLKRDGGDCELVEVNGNKVMVKLSGACVFCSLASATVEGIQAKIVERLGELVRLIPVPTGGPSRPIQLGGMKPPPMKSPV